MPYEEIRFAHGNPANGVSPVETWYTDEKNRLQFRAKVFLLVNGPDVPTAITGLLSETGGVYPYLTTALARKIEGRGRGVYGPSGYTECVLEVDYDTAGPRWVNGSYVQERMIAQQMWIEPPTGDFKWGDGMKLTNNEMATSYPFLGWTYELTLGRLLTQPSVPFNYLGSCNSGGKSCYYLGYSFGSQTVLFGAPSVAADAAMGSGTRYTAMYRHSIKPSGWNTFWNAANCAWEPLYDKDGNLYIQYPVVW